MSIPKLVTDLPTGDALTRHALGSYRQRQSCWYKMKVGRIVTRDEAGEVGRLDSKELYVAL